EVTADYVNIRGFTVMNATNRPNAGIYLGSDVDHCTIADNNVSNNHIGIALDASCENTIINNTVRDNGYGFYLYRFSNNNKITNNTVFSNEYDGINLRDSCRNNTIKNNTITNNSVTNNYAGIHLFKSKDNLIYNNYFNNTNNARDDDGHNTWNIKKTAGTNIIGGPYLGGNYWADYTGKDWNHDGLGEPPYYSPNVAYPPYGIKYGADYSLVPCTSSP
ncbi:MAG: NosD domain-containing protein, partial [Euryarchaeota archaeon]|nr:NosD domain-containing protein [Euryarchaeota archaeon]